MVITKRQLRNLVKKNGSENYRFEEGRCILENGETMAFLDDLYEQRVIHIADATNDEINKIFGK